MDSDISSQMSTLSTPAICRLLSWMAMILLHLVTWMTHMRGYNQNNDQRISQYHY